jgi:hypothetical protein
MNSLNPDQLMMVLFVCAVPVSIIFLKRSSALFLELAQYYNGKIYSPYFKIALGVEIPFKEFFVLFDPYDTATVRGKGKRTKRFSLIWKMSKPAGPKAMRKRGSVLSY